MKKLVDSQVTQLKCRYWCVIIVVSLNECHEEGGKFEKEAKCQVGGQTKKELCCMMLGVWRLECVGPVPKLKG